MRSGDGGRPIELGAPDPAPAVAPHRRAAPALVVVLAVAVMVATVALVVAQSSSGDVDVAGVEACNIGHFAQTTSSEDGVAVATFSVRRIVVLDGREVDCGSEAQRCLLGMGMISDYDTSGGVLVDFDSSVPLPDPPSATVQPARDLVDGDRVEVRVAGLTPRGTAGVSLCDEGQEMCVELGRGAHGTADDDGVAVLELQVWRQFAMPMWGRDHQARNIDCATERCVLSVWGESPGSRSITPVILGFDPAGSKRTAPTLTVEPGPHRAGEEIQLAVVPVPADTVAEVVLCSLAGCTGGMSGSDRVGDELRIRFRPESAACPDRPCTLTVHLYGPGEGGPPPLIPAPVELDISG